MALSQKILETLAALQDNADIPPGIIAKQLGVTESTVRRTLSKALQDGTICRRVYVNFFDLGLQQYAIFFSIPAKLASQKERVRKVLLQAPFVELLIEVSGRFNFGLVLTVQSVFDLEQFLDFVTARSNVEILDLNLQIRTGWHYFGVKYLSKKFSPEPLAVVPTGNFISLSEDEARILCAFSGSSDGTRARIAKELRIAPTTLQYQLQKLERKRVVLGVRYQITSDAVGYHPFRVLVSTRDPLSSHRGKFYKWARQNPYVVSYMHGVGPWQYELRVEAPNHTQATSVVDDLSERLSDFVENVELVPVAHVHKMNLIPDIRLFER